MLWVLITNLPIVAGTISLIGHHILTELFMFHNYDYFKSTTVIPVPPNCMCSSWKCLMPGTVDK